MAPSPLLNVLIFLIAIFPFPDRFADMCSIGESRSLSFFLTVTKERYPGFFFFSHARRLPVSITLFPLDQLRLPVTSARTRCRWPFSP